LLRLVVPYFCVAALVTSALSGPVILRVFFVLQVVFYALGFLSLTPAGKSRLASPARLSWTFIVLNAAAVVGAWVFITGRDRTIWR
jgi:hypothetical protein